MIEIKDLKMVIKLLDEKITALMDLKTLLSTKKLI